MRSHSEHPPIRTARPFRFSAERRLSAPERLSKPSKPFMCLVSARSHLPLSAGATLLKWGRNASSCGLVAAAGLGLARAQPAAPRCDGADARRRLLRQQHDRRHAPDGTSVGTPSGAPSVIPAGYYTVLITGPMGLPSGLPYFHLSGPAVDLLSNLNEGGVESDTEHVTLQPSSLYTWTDDALPGVACTSRQRRTSRAPRPTAAVSPKSGKPAASQDLVGLGRRADARDTERRDHRRRKDRRLVQGKAHGQPEAGSYRVNVIDRSPCRRARAGQEGPRGEAGDRRGLRRHALAARHLAKAPGFSSRRAASAGYPVVVTS